jgi:hypothetical protein
MHPEPPAPSTASLQPRIQLWLDGRLVAVTRVLKAAVGGVFLQGEAPGIHLGDLVQLRVVPGDAPRYCTPWHGVVTATSPGGTNVLVARNTEQLYRLLHSPVAKAPADGS